MQKQVGRRIRELREARGLTQEKLAEAAGINAKYVGAIERGTVNLTLASISKICKTLDVPVTELFTGVGSNPKSDREEVLRLVDAILKQGDEKKLARLRVFPEQVFR